MLRADDLTPVSLFRAVWRYRLAAIALGLVAAASGYGFSLFIPDSYTATTLVLVEDVRLPQGYAKSTATINLGERLRTLRERTLSRSRLDKLVHRFQLFGDPADPVLRESVLASTAGRIAIAVTGTEAFRISFTYEDPRVAAQVANSLAEIFIQTSEQALQRQVEDTASGLQAQLQNVRMQLAGKETEIRDYKTANLGGLPEQLASNAQAIDRLQQSLAANAAQLANARAREREILAELPASSEVVAQQSVRERARQALAGRSAADVATTLASYPPPVRLEALKLQRESLLREYTARHPDVMVIDVQIATLEGIVALEGPSAGSVASTAGAMVAVAPDPRLAPVRLEIAALEQARPGIQEQLRTYQGRVDSAPEVEQQLRELEREYNSMLNSYQGLVSRNIEAELAGNLQASAPFARFRVIDPAVVPQRPSSPLRVLFLLGGGAVGFGLVCGGVLLREMVIEPLNCADEVERYAEVPVLATIPFIESPKSRRKARMRRWVSVATVATVLAAVFVLRLMLRP